LKRQTDVFFQIRNHSFVFFFLACHSSVDFFESFLVIGYFSFFPIFSGPALEAGGDLNEQSQQELSANQSEISQLFLQKSKLTLGTFLIWLKGEAGSLHLFKDSLSGATDKIMAIM
jgi:hypothetical protein